MVKGNDCGDTMVGLSSKNIQKIVISVGKIVVAYWDLMGTSWRLWGQNIANNLWLFNDIKFNQSQIGRFELRLRPPELRSSDPLGRPIPPVVPASARSCDEPRHGRPSAVPWRLRRRQSRPRCNASIGTTPSGTMAMGQDL